MMSHPVVSQPLAMQHRASLGEWPYKSPSPLSSDERGCLRSATPAGPTPSPTTAYFPGSPPATTSQPAQGSSGSHPYSPSSMTALWEVRRVGDEATAVGGRGHGYAPPPPLRPRALMACQKPPSSRSCSRGTSSRNVGQDGVLAAGQANIFDEDANAEAIVVQQQQQQRRRESELHANPNATVYGTASPISVADVGVGGATCAWGTAALGVARGQPCLPQQKVLHSIHRAGSAHAGEGTTAAALLLRPTPMAPPPGQPPQPSTCAGRHALADNCGVVIRELDPVTHEVVAYYRCGALLGCGGFAKVYEFVELQTRMVYACKVIDRTKLSRSAELRVQNEIAIHGSLQHANIVRLVRAFWDDYHCYILLERCRTRNLMDLSKDRGSLGEADLRHIMRQLTSAVEYMHRNGVLHRDLKLGNIMSDYEGNVKVGDFGFACRLKDPRERKLRVCGTPNYIAPEILACQEPHARGYGYEVDVWSLGVLFFILACGYAPFQGHDVASTYQRIRTLRFRPPSEATAGHLPESCRRLITDMLQPDPRRRPTPRQVLESAFLAGCPRVEHPRSLVPRPARDDPAGLTTQPRHPTAHSPRGAPSRRRLGLVSPSATATACVPGASRDEEGDAEVRHGTRGKRALLSPAAPSPHGGVERATMAARGSSSGGGGGGGLDEETPPAATAAPDGNTRAARLATKAQHVNATTRATSSFLGDYHPHAPRRRCGGGSAVAEATSQTWLPRVVVGSAVFIRKYGYGFLLQLHGERTLPVVFLNDKTKLIYDEAADVAYYYARQLRSASDEASAHLGKPHRPLTYCDELHRYEHASRVLQQQQQQQQQQDNGVPSTRPDCGDDPCHAAAQKKLAITRCLQPYLLRQDCVDDTVSRLFTSFAARAGGTTRSSTEGRNKGENDEAAVLYVKDAVLEPGGADDAATDGHRGLAGELTRLAVRFADQSFQVSLRCECGGCAPGLVPRAAALPLAPGAPWALDLVLFDATHAVVALETGATRVTCHVRDVRSDLCAHAYGRDVRDAVTGGLCMTLPTELLRLVGGLLGRVRCPSSLIECLC